MQSQSIQSADTAVSITVSEDENTLIDVADVCDKNGYGDIKTKTIFVSKSLYHNKNCLNSLVYHGYGTKRRTLLQSAVYHDNVPRVEELIEANADPDFYHGDKNGDDFSSALVYSILRGNICTLDSLINYHYKRQVDSYEYTVRGIDSSSDLVILRTPVTDSPVSFGTPYPIRSTIGYRTILFSSLSHLSLGYDFAATESLGGTYTPLHWILSSGVSVPLPGAESIQRIFRSLLYQGLSSTSATGVTPQTYSCLWQSFQMIPWISNLLTGMILCKEPHSHEHIMDAWETYIPSPLRETHRLVLYIACLHTGNSSLFYDLYEQLPLSDYDIRDLGNAIGFYGRVAELEYCYKQSQWSDTVGTLLESIGSYAIRRHHLHVLQYLHESVPEYNWTSVTISESISAEAVEITNWLQSTIYPSIVSNVTNTE